MHLSVYSHDANPAVDRRLCRKSRAYCDAEVTAGRAFRIYDDQGRWTGIQRMSAEHIAEQSSNHPGPSIGTHGPISRHESNLNAENRHKTWLSDQQTSKLLRDLSQRIEERIDQAIAERVPIPRSVRRMAADVKVLAYPYFVDTKAPRVAVGICKA